MNDIIDDLTGLMNARVFISQLETIVREGAPLVVVMMDLDHMLGINKDFGHQAGDEWIRANARRFAEAFGGTDNLVGRYGGDEFLAAVRGMDPAQAYQKAEALRASVQEDCPQVTFDGELVQPGRTISLGLAAYPEHAADVNDLIDKGMTALRRAKISGGNQVVLYQEIDLLTGVQSKIAIERALEEAVANRKNEPVSVFVLDIDYFKAINDDHGHRAGDEVLKRLGHILLTNFKDSGKVGRISGDEFIVILPGQRTDSAFILADEVRRLVEDSEIQASLNEHSYSLRFHISGGIASAPGDGAEAVELRGKAEEALYRSKITGRNRISLPSSAQMITKTSYYTQAQLERLAKLARSMDKTEAFLLREALDDLLLKYKE